MSASRKPNLDNIGAAEDLLPPAGLRAGFLSTVAGPACTYTGLQPLPAGLSSAQLIFLLLPPCIPPHSLAAGALFSALSLKVISLTGLLEGRYP